MTEILTDPKETRYTLFPIQHDEIYKYYKLAESNFWTTEELDLSKDMVDYEKLTDNELIGIPFQVIVGKRDLKDNLIELKNRTTNESKKMSPEEAINFLLKLNN